MKTTDLSVKNSTSEMLQKIVEFKDCSRFLSDFPVLFKADLIFKDFSRKLSKFKYFSSLCKPCHVLDHMLTIKCLFLIKAFNQAVQK